MGHQHVRQRSYSSSPLANNPFDDSHRGPAAHNVMMDDPRSRAQANLDTREYLYGETAMQNDDTRRYLRRSRLLDNRAQATQKPEKPWVNQVSPRPRSTSTNGSLRPPAPTPSRTNDPAAMSPGLLNSFEKGRAYREADDLLHDVGAPPKRIGIDRRIPDSKDLRGPVTIFTWRLWGNMGAIVIIMGVLVFMFAGYPMYDHFTRNSLSNFGAAGLGGTNSTGQVPSIPAFRGLIDEDTPEAAMTKVGADGVAYQLVFSDEFEQAGRTFYPGDDPYWEAVDLWYHQTGDIEWYDPGQITTRDGYLEIMITRESLADSHDRGYLSGMLQSWNKFCFTGGIIEVAVSLPGDTTAEGFWPGAWTMGNLGRAGFGGSLHGMWPYSYTACDIGTLPNQTDPATGGPAIVTTTGDPGNNNLLSFLEGQRLSACTCPGELHPGPTLSDGTLKGRSAPEIDILEALVTWQGVGEVSQSAQFAPFNAHYDYTDNSTAALIVYDTPFATELNTYKGGVYQQVASGLSATDATTYNSTTRFGLYGFEYLPSEVNGFGTGYVTWTQGDRPMWRMNDISMAADPVAQVSERPVTKEPMYIIMNLGMSEGFGNVELDELEFPAMMRVDYVRVYQRPDMLNVGCSPPDYPTKDYIDALGDAYTNPNHTVYQDLGFASFPKNRLIDQC